MPTDHKWVTYTAVAEYLQEATCERCGKLRHVDSMPGWPFGPPTFYTAAGARITGLKDYEEPPCLEEKEISDD
jgi:hypothetical protein